MSTESRQHPQPGTCGCNICEFSRELRAATPDIERLGRLVDGLLDQWSWSEMRLHHLTDAVSRFCGRVDAPEYLREALKVAADHA